MREIKFRGHEKNTGWHYGYYFVNTKDGVEEHWIRESDVNWLVDRESVGQFVGLKDDDSGKEIYAGDIVKGHFGDEDDYDNPTSEINMVGLVHYDFCGFSFKVVRGDKRSGMVNYFKFAAESHTIEWNDIGSGFFNDMKILGNKYENPCLLEGLK